jgi:hypothetical protein
MRMRAGRGRRKRRDTLGARLCSWCLEVAIVRELVRLVRAWDAADDELNGVSRFGLGVAAGVPVAPGAGCAVGDAEG